MILKFPNEINGKPTCFAEKVWAGLIEERKIPAYSDVSTKWGQDLTRIIGQKPKIHAIIGCNRNECRQGDKLHVVMRSKGGRLVQVAPELLCLSVESIFITYPGWGPHLEITVGGNYSYYPIQERIAINEGFDNYDEFMEYYAALIDKSIDKCFAGWIVHWSDLRYNTKRE